LPWRRRASFRRAGDPIDPIKERDALLAFYDFPAKHWKHLRSTNVIESSALTELCAANQVWHIVAARPNSGQKALFHSDYLSEGMIRRLLLFVAARASLL
jgi:hypothetical protein